MLLQSNNSQNVVHRTPEEKVGSKSLVRKPLCQNYCCDKTKTLHFIPFWPLHQWCKVNMIKLRGLSQIKAISLTNTLPPNSSLHTGIQKREEKEFIFKKILDKGVKKCWTLLNLSPLSPHLFTILYDKTGKLHNLLLLPTEVGWLS